MKPWNSTITCPFRVVGIDADEAESRVVVEESVVETTSELP